jgi:signal transduction histidine kinase
MPASRRGGGPAETMPPRPSPPPHLAPSPPPAPAPASAESLAALVGQTQSLSERVAELERAERGRLSLLRQLVTAQEDERRRLAANLHDDTIQALAAALLHLDVLEARVDRAVRDHVGGGGRDAWDAVRSSATRVRQNVEHGLASARTFLFDLRPPVLDDAGLKTALQRQLDRLAEQNDCAVELRWAVAERLDPDRETILFRAVQEALANVVKHAHAAKVTIRAWRDGGMVVVEVADDGCGFDPVEALAWASAAGHLGLRFMTDRVEGAGGSLCIDAVPGQGTRVELRLPAAGQGGDPVPLDRADQPGR